MIDHSEVKIKEDIGCAEIFLKSDHDVLYATGTLHMYVLSHSSNYTQ